MLLFPSTSVRPTTERGTFVPLHYDSGDAFQFDWREDFAVLGGEHPNLPAIAVSAAASR